MAKPPNNVWNLWCESVADLMKVHTRPYVTPLVQDVTGKPAEIGTGTFIQRDGIDVLTCEHVSRLAPFEHEFFGHDGLLKFPVHWTEDAPLDVAIADVPGSHWGSVTHSSAPLPLSRFAPRHQPVESEILFFRGFAGENVVLNIGHAQLIATGYCSQEKPGAGDANIFEMLWHPPGTTVSSRTSADTRARFKHNHPGGLSGSLVWNTRFVEKGCNLATWSPQDAVVTGLLRRWDFNTKTLLVWRVEHLQAWLAAH